MPSINKNSAFFIFLLVSAIVLFLIVFLQPGNDASESEPSNAPTIMPMPPIDGPNPKDAKRCNGPGEENTREYPYMFIFGRKDSGKSQAAKAVLLKGADILIPELFVDHIEMPIPACPSAAFMNGVGHILIDFVDQQVLDFLAQISPQITGKHVELDISFHVDEGHWYMDEKKRDAVAQVVQIFLSGSAQIQLYSSLVNTLFLPPAMDFGMNAIYLSISAKAEIQQLLKILSTDRGDGRQHVVGLEIYNPKLISDILDAIEKDFHASTTKLPQPFYIRFLPTAGWQNLVKPPQSQEQNPETGETLAIMNQINIGRKLSATFRLNCLFIRINSLLSSTIRLVPFLLFILRRSIQYLL